MKSATETKTKKKKKDPRAAGRADIELGQLIRGRRAELKITQSQLADKIGLSFQAVAKV